MTRAPKVIGAMGWQGVRRAASLLASTLRRIEEAKPAKRLVAKGLDIL